MHELVSSSHPLACRGFVVDSSSNACYLSHRTNDGAFLSLGFYNGQISLRDKSGGLEHPVPASDSPPAPPMALTERHVCPFCRRREELNRAQRTCVELAVEPLARRRDRRPRCGACALFSCRARVRKLHVQLKHHLAVHCTQACWDQTLSFYDANGKQIGRDKSLGFDPTSIRHFSNGEYICVSGVVAWRAHP